ncbi:MAG: cysteine hydrolase [Thermoplasmata archaeon]|nr:cysteine hydrolase [Thermoplasmata archaeon]
MIRDYIWGKHLALIVIDPQRKFTLSIDEWSERMVPAVEGINRFLKIFRENGAPVIFIHFDGPSHTGYHGEDEDEWLPGIESAETDIVVHKKHMNCFKETDLEKILKDNNIDCAVFTGMLTEFCVATTYFAASERGVFPYMGKGALIPYNKDGNWAAEIMCSMVEPATVERYLKGEQPPIVLDE